MSDRTALVRRRRARYGPNAETGFTLIELLVVVVILGILSGVVVFAVRGVGDKGQGAAVGTDERTIRTAQEAYCAKAGRYATDMGQLTGDLPVSGTDPAKYKFLSEPSEYHKLEPGPPACGGTPGYKIVCKVADCSAVGTGPSGPTTTSPTTTDPGVGPRWDMVSPGPTIVTIGPLVRLADGRVFASGFDSSYLSSAAQIWDPVMNTWTLTDPPPYGVDGDFSSAALLLTDDPTTSTFSECSNGTINNCGKVFVYGKFLFDPTAEPTKQWETIPNNLPRPPCDEPGPSPCTATFCVICSRGGFQNFEFVQLMNRVAPCGAKCGTVIMFTDTLTFRQNNYDAFDPRTNTYSIVPLNNDIESAGGAVVQLTDGRIFLCCGSNTPGNRSFFLDVRTLEYSEGAPAPHPYSRFYGAQPQILLPNGDVFVSVRVNNNDGKANDAGIYKPQAGGPGVWRTTPSCIPALALLVAPKGACRTLAALPDGRILTISTKSQFGSIDDTVWVFNPAGEFWSPSPSLSSRDSYFLDAVLMDQGGGACGAYCGKVLVAGNSAEVYTPGLAVPAPTPTGLG